MHTFFSCILPLQEPTAHLGEVHSKTEASFWQLDTVSQVFNTEPKVINLKTFMKISVKSRNHMGISKLGK